MDIGDKATIFGPAGKFILKPAAKNIVFLTCGIGITPIIPMLSELQNSQFQGEVLLFNSNKTAASDPYVTVLGSIKMAHYTYRPVITSEEKRIDIDLLNTYLKDLHAYHYYVVGTSSFLTSMQKLLDNEKIDRGQIYIDDFG